MKHLLIALLLIACSEQVEYKQTLVVVTGIEQTATGCVYSIEPVPPHQPYKQTKIEDKCQKYTVGQEVSLVW
jgi:hypothetical protein